MTITTLPTLSTLPTVYEFQGAQVRVINREDDPWFVASDVCRVLEIAHGPSAMQRLDPEDRMTVATDHSHAGHRGGAQSLTIINESGLYSLVLTSRKPEARAFKRWVTTEVLPSIRKHGAYIAGQEKVATGEMSREELLASAVKAAGSVIAEMEQRALAAEQKVVELAPVAAVAQEHFNRGRRFPVHSFARTLDGVNSAKIKPDLAEAGYLYPCGRGYRVYSQYRDKLFVEKRDDLGGRALTIYATPKGEETITRLYQEGRLTMRKNYAEAA